MKLKPLLAAAICIMALVGCADRTKPILTPDTMVTNAVTAEQVKQAILSAGFGRKWIMTVVGPGVINATQKARDHSATVRINYSARAYSIHYVSSVNMMASDGQIHRAYNNWVNNLDRDIQLKLAMAAVSAQ